VDASGKGGGGGAARPATAYARRRARQLPVRADRLPGGAPRASSTLGSTKRYYSFDWGNAHVVALDSELYYGDTGSNPEEQRTFLERDLAATRKCWRVVFLHRSPYGSSRHGDGRVREDLEPSSRGTEWTWSSLATTTSTSARRP
jgi:hypothetical protein